MECTKCGSQEAFNRAVINQLTGQELGFYCKGCETEQFGEILDDYTWHRNNGCAFCDNAGKYKLPKLDCIIERDNGAIDHIEYLLNEYTVSLCPKHTSQLFDEEIEFEEKESSKQKPTPTITA